MQQFIGCDAHKRFSVFVAVDERGRASKPTRVEHVQKHFADFLKQLPTESEIAIESTGHWYWLVDEMERAGHHVHLANPMEAKKRMGRTHKTDALDAKGLAILLRNGTLPESWIPPGPLRDRRELLRTRMALRDLRSSLKHRIHAAVDRYGLHTDSLTDLFGIKGREYLASRLAEFPPETARMVQIQLDALDELAAHIECIEQRIHAEIAPDLRGPTFTERARRRRDSRSRHLVGDRRRQPFSARRKSSELRRTRSARVFQRRSHTPRRHIAFCEPVFEMGLCRSGELRSAAKNASAFPHRLSLSETAGKTRAWPRHRCRRPASRRGQLLDPPQTGKLPGTTEVDFVQEGVSARHVWPFPATTGKRPRGECETLNRYAHARSRANTWLMTKPQARANGR